jgi:hypothetical protein
VKIPSAMELEAMARKHVRAGTIFSRRGTRNWVRNGPGDEGMARKYWADADLEFWKARSYVDSATYERLRTEVRKEVG